MIWEQKVSVIIMTTELVERNVVIIIIIIIIIIIVTTLLMQFLFIVLCIAFSCFMQSFYLASLGKVLSVLARRERLWCD